MTAVLDDVKDHLEFLGYRVKEKPEAEGVYGATHDKRWHFVFNEQVGGIFFRSFVPTDDVATNAELESFVNDLHTKAIVARFYIDEDGDLAIEAWWPNIYERSAFGTFVDAWNQDIGAMIQHPKTEDLLE